MVSRSNIVVNREGGMRELRKLVERLSFNIAQISQ